MSHSGNRHFSFGLLLVVLGVLILLDNLNLFDFGDLISTFWPLIFVFWGVSFLMKSREEETPKSPELIPVTNAGPVPPEDRPKNKIQPRRVNKLMGDIVLRVEGNKLSNASYSVILGEIFLDLSNLESVKEPAKIYLNVTIGDIRLMLNPKINYRIKASAIIGDVNIFDNKDSGFQAQMTWENGLAGPLVEIFINVFIGDSVVW
jgi:predicted membrane protein